MPETEADPRLQGALGLSKPLQRSFGRCSTPKTRMRTGVSPPLPRNTEGAGLRMRTTPNSVNDKWYQVLQRKGVTC